MPPNTISYYFHLLNTSPSQGHLRQLHAYLLRSDHLFSSVILSTKLLICYSLPPFSSTHSSLTLFHQMPHRNSYAYNSILSILTRSSSNPNNPFPLNALHIFISMHAREVPIDKYTLPPVLRACLAVRVVRIGMSVHGFGLKMGFSGSLFFGSGLVAFYMGLNIIDYARKVFDGMCHKDYVLWTSMLSGYTKIGEAENTLNVFREMVRNEVHVDDVVCITLFFACSQLGVLWIGKSVHGYCIRMNFSFPLELGNALVDMYVKCGAFSYAEKVFVRLCIRDVISWSCLILGHGLNGNAFIALDLFKKMREEKIRPNSVTFLGLLSACAHSGMVDKAWEFFNMMKVYNIVPELKHYACIVDTLGRAGQVAEAEKFMDEMPVDPDEAVLGALLFGCRVHGNIDVGERVARQLMAMRPDKSGYFVILANLYSDAGRYDDADKIRGLMENLKVNKLVGRSSIE